MYGENGELEYGGSLKNKDKYGQPVEDWVDLITKEQALRIFNHGKEIGLLDNKDKTPVFKYFSPPDRNQLKEKK